MNYKEAGSNIVDIRDFLPNNPPSGKREESFAPATITLFQGPKHTEVPEESQFKVARRLNDKTDSLPAIENLGLEVTGKSSFFYSVILPPGFVKKDDGYWTSILDPDGNEVLSQFNEGVPFAHCVEKRFSKAI